MPAPRLVALVIAMAISGLSHEARASTLPTTSKPTASLSATVQVPSRPPAKNKAPTAVFSHLIEGRRVTFVDASIDDAGVISWAWNFGDGSGTTATSPTHEYAKPGVYSVSLTVKDRWGLTSYASQTVSVKDPEPELVDEYIYPGKSRWMGSGYSAHNAGLGAVPGPSFSEFRFDNVTWYDQDGSETGRGSITGRYYYDFGQLSNAVCSNLIPYELTTIGYEAHGFLMSETMRSAQQTAADPNHPDASYFCRDNNLLTLVVAPIASTGDSRCATGRMKSVSSNNWPPFTYATGRRSPFGVYPFVQGSLGDGAQLISSEGFYLIPAVKTCD
jgi:PKD repeat protein